MKHLINKKEITYLTCLEKTVIINFRNKETLELNFNTERSAYDFFRSYTINHLEYMEYSF